MLSLSFKGTAQIIMCWWNFGLIQTMWFMEWGLRITRFVHSWRILRVLGFNTFLFSYLWLYIYIYFCQSNCFFYRQYFILKICSLCKSRWLSLFPNSLFFFSLFFKNYSFGKPSSVMRTLAGTWFFFIFYIKCILNLFGPNYSHICARMVGYLRFL